MSSITCLKDFLVLALYSRENLVFMQISTCVSISSIRIHADSLGRIVRNGRKIKINLSIHLFVWDI